MIFAEVVRHALRSREGRITPTALRSAVCSLLAGAFLCVAPGHATTADELRRVEDRSTVKVTTTGRGRKPHSHKS